MAEDFFGAIGKFFARTAHGAVDKTGAMMEKSKVSAKISGEQKEIDKLCQQIGESIIERAAAGEIQLNDRENLMLEEIGVHRDNIKEFRKVMASLRNMKICPACESLIAIDVAFCPKCGAPTPVPEPEEVMAEEVVIDDADISYEEVDKKEEAEAPEEASEETIFIEEPDTVETIKFDEVETIEEPEAGEEVKPKEEPEAEEGIKTKVEIQFEEETEAKEEPQAEEGTKPEEEAEPAKKEETE
jgi:RNA polymerase subunit RPABC4/transcription elongation factor Spt4